MYFRSQFVQLAHRSVAAFFVPVATALAGVVVYPSGGTIEWTNPAGWSTNHVPGGGETPQISTGTVTVTGAPSVDNINFFGGAITNPTNGNGTLTITSIGSEWRAGTLNSSSGGKLTLEIASGGNLLISTSAAHDFNASAITNNGAISWTGGDLRAGNSATFTNASGGIFNDSSTGSFGSTGGAPMTFTNASGANYNASVSKSIPVSFTNDGALTVSAGTLNFTGGGSNTGTINVSTAGATVQFSSNFSLAGGSSLTGPGTMQVTGGTTTLAGANTLTGTVAISAGTLNVNPGASLGSNAVAVALTGGTLTLNNAAQLIASLSGTGGTINLGTGHTLTDNQAATTSFAGILTGAGGLVKTGTGTLTLSGANTFTGPVTVSAGTLTVNSSATLSSNSGIFAALTVNGGTLNLNNPAQTIASLSGTGGTVNLGTGHTLTDNQTTMASFAGTITGAGSLVKAGIGTLALSGINSYNSGTTVSAGTLSINNTSGSGVGTGPLTVQSGATLGGSGFIGGAATIANGGHLAPGNSPGTLTFTNGLTLAAGAILDFQLGTTSDKIVVASGVLTGPAGTGVITLNLADAGSFVAGTYPLFDFSAAGTTTSGFYATDFSLGTPIPGFTYNLALAGSTLALTATASAIPEPSAYAALAGAALLGFAVWRRRRDRTQAAHR